MTILIITSSRTMLKKNALSLIGLLLLSVLQTARADVLVLLHGYMGSPNSWENSRINDKLDAAGWQRGGIIIPDTNRFYPDPQRRMANKDMQDISYMIDMPWMRNLSYQAEFIRLALETVSRMRPNEPINLIGHSAGALAARLSLVKYPNPAIKRLISIAAPNLGTSRAIDALELTDPIFAPLDAVRNMFGGKLYNTVRRSRDLVYDFTPPSERNPTVLYWLNQQPHPDIDYISVVREDRRGRDKDWLMSADSQDLNNVPALSGKAKSFMVDSGHQLNQTDGDLLVSILSDNL